MSSEKEAYPCLEDAVKKFIDDMEKDERLEPARNILPFFFRIKELHDKDPAPKKAPIRLLDIGVGEGILTDILKLLLGSSVDITGIDIFSNHKIHDYVEKGVLKYVENDCMDYEPEEKFDIVYSNFLMEPLGVRNAVNVSRGDKRFPELAQKKIKAMKRKAIEFAKPGGLIIHVTGTRQEEESIEHRGIPTRTVYSGPGLLINMRERRINQL